MSVKKIVGSVTEAEKNEIKALFERKNGLSELIKIVPPDNEPLYEKIVADMGRTATLFQQWWDGKAEKNKWENVPGGRWEIDFDTNDIYLVV